MNLSISDSDRREPWPQPAQTGHAIAKSCFLSTALSTNIQPSPTRHGTWDIAGSLTSNAQLIARKLFRAVGGSSTCPTHFAFNPDCLSLAVTLNAKGGCMLSLNKQDNGEAAVLNKIGSFAIHSYAWGSYGAKYLNRVEYDPSGSLLFAKFSGFTSYAANIKIFDTKNTNLIGRPKNLLRISTGEFSSTCIAPAAGMVAMAYPEIPFIKIIDNLSPEKLSPREHTIPIPPLLPNMTIRSLAVSNDGKRLMVFADSSLGSLLSLFELREEKGKINAELQECFRLGVPANVSYVSDDLSTYAIDTQLGSIKGESAGHITVFKEVRDEGGIDLKPVSRIRYVGDFKLAINPSKTLLAIGGRNNKVNVYSLVEEESPGCPRLLAWYESLGIITALRFSPKHDLLAIGGCTTKIFGGEVVVFGSKNLKIDKHGV